MAKPRREVMHRVVHRLSDGEALYERRVYARDRPTLARVTLPAFAAEPADFRAGAWLHTACRAEALLSSAPARQAKRRWAIRHMEAGDA